MTQARRTVVSKEETGVYPKERLERLGEVKNLTHAQKREISREESRMNRGQWLVKSAEEGSLIRGMDEETYITLGRISRTPIF